jgi:hypothetical protein
MHRNISNGGTHLIPESVASGCNNFIRGLAMAARVTPVFDQGAWCVRIAQNMIASIINRSIQFHRPGWNPSCFSFAWNLENVLNNHLKLILNFLLKKSL